MALIAVKWPTDSRGLWLIGVYRTTRWAMKCFVTGPCCTRMRWASHAGCWRRSQHCRCRVISMHRRSIRLLLVSLTVRSHHVFGHTLVFLVNMCVCHLCNKLTYLLTHWLKDAVLILTTRECGCGFKGQRCQLVTLCHPDFTWIINFWHLGTLMLSPEHQSARMSEIKNLENLG